MKASHESAPAKQAKHNERSEHHEPPRRLTTAPGPAAAAQGLTLDGFGNRALLSLLHSGTLQRKARISPPDDPRERDADRAAEAVTAGLPASPTRAYSAAAGINLYGGSRLDQTTRARMESGFGENFGDVRVHTGHQASEAAEALESRAFTIGNDIVFAERQFAPETTEGQRLLAHELAHVVQQRRPGGSAPTEAHEAEAEAAGGLAGQLRFPVMLPSLAGSIQRKPRASRKEAVVQVVWTDNSWDLKPRVVYAVADSRGFSAVPGTSLPQAFHGPVEALFDSPGGSRIKPGQRVKLRASADYDPDGIPELTHVSLTFDDPTLAGAQKAPAVGATTTAAIVHERSGQAKIDHSRDILQKLYAQFAAEADRDGYSALDLTVANDGTDLDPIYMAKVGQQHARPAGTPLLDEAEAWRQLEYFMNVVVQSKGAWKARFTRFQPGAMIFKSFERLPDIPAPPPQNAGTKPRVRTVAEEYEEATGTVYPPRINKALQEIAIKGLHDANPFLLKNLPYTIGGIVVPMGAMKLLTMDMQLGNIIRIEWAVDEDVVEASEIVRSDQPSASTTSVRDLKPGDVIDMPQGQQRVVSVEPHKITTEPNTAPQTGATAAGNEGTALAQRTPAQVTATLRSWGLTDGEIASFGGADASKLGASSAARVARLSEHFSPADIKFLGGYLEDSGKVLDDAMVEELIGNIPRGGLEKIGVAQARVTQTGVVVETGPETGVNIRQAPLKRGTPKGDVSEGFGKPLEPLYSMAEKQLGPVLEKTYGPDWTFQERVYAPNPAKGEKLGSTVPEYLNDRLRKVFEVKRWNIEEMGIGPKGQVRGSPSQGSVEALERARTQLAARQANIKGYQQNIVFNLTGQPVNDAVAVGKQLRTICEKNLVQYDRYFIQVGDALVPIY